MRMLKAVCAKVRAFLYPRIQTPPGYVVVWKHARPLQFWWAHGNCSYTLEDAAIWKTRARAEETLRFYRMTKDYEVMSTYEAAQYAIDASHRLGPTCECHGMENCPAKWLPQ